MSFVVSVMNLCSIALYMFQMWSWGGQQDQWNSFEGTHSHDNNTSEIALTFTVHRQKNSQSWHHGYLDTHIFKKGFLTTPFTKCHGCPGTHTFKEGLSRSVHRGYPGTHTFKEGLSRSIHCGCTGTLFFFFLFFFFFFWGGVFSFLFSGTVCDNLHA